MSEMPPIEPPPPTGAAPAGLPWEEPNAGLGSFFPTVGRIITSPIAAFGSMAKAVDLIRPVAYFVAFVLFSTAVSQLWSALFFDRSIAMAKAFVPAQFQSILAAAQRPTPMSIVLTVVVMFFLYLIVLFIWSALLHLTLALLGGAQGGFATTLRVACYARTADVAVVIPGLGGLIAFFWARVLEMIGLSEAHKTDGWKAVLAVLMPMALCCACLVGLAAMFGAMIAQALQHR